jgi:hypothetical protein
MQIPELFRAEDKYTAYEAFARQDDIRRGLVGP